MDVFQFGKLVDDGGELFTKVGLGEFDFPHVKAPDPADLVLLVHHSGCLALGLGQDDIDKVLGGGDHRNLLEVVLHHRGLQ